MFGIPVQRAFKQIDRASTAVSTEGGRVGPRFHGHFLDCQIRIGFQSDTLCLRRTKTRLQDGGQRHREALLKVSALAIFRILLKRQDMAAVFRVQELQHRTRRALMRPADATYVVARPVGPIRYGETRPDQGRYKRISDVTGDHGVDAAGFDRQHCDRWIIATGDEQERRILFLKMN